ncbi:hypothetical protein BGZ67_006609 [Mortierella alpina]|nr:hypothetical protein BGZ67_006609 [Mortierella alpina]
MNPDIVCVQELDEPDYVGDFGLHMGALGYSGGRKKRQVCVATTNLLNGCDTDLRKLGQLVSIMAAAEVQLKKDPAVLLIITGDFNTRLDSPLFKENACPPLALRRGRGGVPAGDLGREEVADSSTFAKTVLDDVRSREVSQSVHTASVYDFTNIVDHIFYGQAAGVLY